MVLCGIYVLFSSLSNFPVVRLERSMICDMNSACCVYMCFYVSVLGSENKSVVLASTAIQLLDERKSPIAAGKSSGPSSLTNTLPHWHRLHYSLFTLLRRLCFTAILLSNPTSLLLLELKHSPRPFSGCAALFLHVLGPASTHAQKMAKVQRADIWNEDHFFLQVLIEAKY